MEKKENKFAKEFLIHSNFLTIYFIYFIKEEKNLFSMFYFEESFFLSNICIFIFLLVLNYILITYCKKKILNNDEIKISSVKQVNTKYFSNNIILYMIPFIIYDDMTFNYIFVFCYLLTYFSNFYFYNPILIFFGWNYYEMKTNDGIYISIISKNKYFGRFIFNKYDLGKIDDYSYIDKT